MGLWGTNIKRRGEIPKFFQSNFLRNYAHFQWQFDIPLFNTLSRIDVTYT
jgi:hypothetical protein